MVNLTGDNCFDKEGFLSGVDYNKARLQDIKYWLSNYPLVRLKNLNQEHAELLEDISDLSQDLAKMVRDVNGLD